MTTIALMGAGGKMGLRLAANLSRTSYTMRYVEISEKGRALLAQRGIAKVLPWQEAVSGADVVILALPDTRIGQVAHEIASRLAAGTLVMISRRGGALRRRTAPASGPKLLHHPPLPSATVQ